MKITLYASFVLSSTFIVGMAGFGYGQTCPPLTAGCLDGSFGSGGTAVVFVPTTQGNLSGTKGALQGDGKILELADTHTNTGNSFTNVVVRYQADGSLDSGFGDGGYLYMNWNGVNNAFGNAYAIAVQSVGTEEKIIVVGSCTFGLLDYVG